MRLCVKEILISSSPGMQAGVVYQFKVRTMNDQGESEYSDTVYAAASSFPAQPNPPTQILS